MCQSDAYLLKNGQEELFMKDVSFLKPVADGELYLEGILGEQRKVKAKIKELFLTDHKIVLEATE
ncbi:MAG TPA: CooT family nickel-binding protein [Firmicutes bacterium]|nr:CooT family nickel-binding protein [Bacillota bacterium]